MLQKLCSNLRLPDSQLAARLLLHRQQRRTLGHGAVDIDQGSRYHTKNPRRYGHGLFVAVLIELAFQDRPLALIPRSLGM